ncbi:hypothetical protein TGME49_324900, partial [Toxoplasma gondii ME49]
SSLAGLFFLTVVFGAMEGILVSIVLSLLWLLRKTSRPQCIVLGRLPQTYIYRNIERFRMAKEEPGIKIVRFDASLNFSNSDYFDSRVRQKLEPSTRYLIIDGSSINDLDVTSIRMLQRLCSHLKQNGITMVFANWKGPMRDFLQRAQFYETLPPENCFLSLHDAVFWAKQKLAAQQKIYEVHALDRAGIPGVRTFANAVETQGNMIRHRRRGHRVVMRGSSRCVSRGVTVLFLSAVGSGVSFKYPKSLHAHMPSRMFLFLVFVYV